ncbi:plastidic triose-phosphate/phosphate translocator [Phaeodactylum tricornutum CCAP 1055/1]|jgi:solute carrier family 35 protein E1|uniref:Plastidic triose-phosphate/phosphate translocator n=2 Tax=Phaeodactylum tricornutum TaxID=2850 RepID=B7FQ79_PHATC|nr:plastidic triose-phosphate/phosphate translocator [Phaeodactylum tricornutum CCAP 1055/1]EEC51811.1 plastidic triose-phosphate/phosphate translocator [Phaeodactylum tricornutum CCAP 1055/1]|eukprot:XP_002177348.1 plastidic triose-phosphate/phosphate translocator [Phaeodactylum tricornutum CCAP 1055/1]
MMMKRALVVLTLSVGVSARASAFAPGAAVKNHAGATQSAIHKQTPFPTTELEKLRPQTSLALSSVGGAKAAEQPKGNPLVETLQVGSYFALWYLFNIAYNIYNKQALNVLAYPWTVATIQMAAGLAYFVPLWVLGIRKAPKLNASELKTLLPIALCHTGVHVGAVIALGAGAVSFAHIVKASEPVVTCALNALLLGQILPLPVYATLLPIIGGVAIASLKELSFTWLALGSAMLSNVSSAARGVLSKKTMSGKKMGENLDAQNLYAVLTAMSTLILIPAMLAMEGTSFFSAFSQVVAKGEYTRKSLAMLIGLSGASYYAYNEVAFLALGKVNPVTHAVGNTIKRVVIIVASVIAFKTPMSTGSIVGSSIAIAGTLLYSLAMNASKKK